MLKKNSIICLMTLLILSGCHTIRPIAIPESTLMTQLPSIHQRVGLVLDENYKNYISKDRGNPLADPQTFLIGESLGVLTENYFRHVSKELKVYDSLEASSNANEVDVIVWPQVSNFDNTVRLGGQRIDVELSGTLYDIKLNPISDLKGQGMARGGIKTSGANATVSTALQLALVQFIQEMSSENILVNT